MGSVTLPLLPPPQSPTSPRETPRPMLSISSEATLPLLSLLLPSLLLQLSLLTPPPTPLRPPCNTLAVRSPPSTVLTTPRSSSSPWRWSTATPSPRSPAPQLTTRSQPPSASPSPPSICHMLPTLLHTSTESNFTIHQHLRQFSSKNLPSQNLSLSCFIHSVRKKELDNSDRKSKFRLGLKITLLTSNSDENAAISKVYKTACG